MVDVDFTDNLWGHNLNITKWDKETRTGRGVCWLTPALRENDVLIVRSELGTMRLVATNVRKSSPTVNDMYSFDIAPEDVVITESEDLWVTKVRRGSGGSSIMDISTKEKARALADEFNKQYQTDRYYIEPYKAEIHAYSRHG